MGARWGVGNRFFKKKITFFSQKKKQNIKRIGKNKPGKEGGSLRKKKNKHNWGRLFVFFLLKFREKEFPVAFCLGAFFFFAYGEEKKKGREFKNHIQGGETILFSVFTKEKKEKKGGGSFWNVKNKKKKKSGGCFLWGQGGTQLLTGGRAGATHVGANAKKGRVGKWGGAGKSHWE